MSSTGVQQPLPDPNPQAHDSLVTMRQDIKAVRAINSFFEMCSHHRVVRRGNGGQLEGAVYLGDDPKVLQATTNYERLKALSQADNDEPLGVPFTVNLSCLSITEDVDSDETVATWLTKITTFQKQNAQFCVHLFPSRASPVAIVPNFPEVRPARAICHYQVRGRGIQIDPIGAHLHPYLVPINLVGQAIDRIVAVARGESETYRAPGSEIHYHPWRPKPVPFNTLLTTGCSQNAQVIIMEQAAQHGLNILHDAIKDSAVHAIIEVPAFSGDAVHILLPDGSKITVEIKLNMTEEVDDFVVFRNMIVSGGPRGDALRRREKSPFRTLRMHDYVALLSEDCSKPCWMIPSGVIQRSWWSADEFVKIPKTAVGCFKFFRNHTDWFDSVYDRIINKFGDLQIVRES